MNNEGGMEGGRKLGFEIRNRKHDFSEEDEDDDEEEGEKTTI